MLADVLSDMGERMLSCQSYATTAANAASLISNILGVTHVMVLRLLPAGDSLLLQGGVGWNQDIIGRTVFDTNKNTFTGFALSSSEPVIIEDLRRETRFTIPAQLSDHGLVSGLCARIPCGYQSFGVIAAFSTESRAFNQDQLSSLRVVAGMLAVSSGCQRTREVRHEDQERIAQAKLEWEATVDALPHFICLLDEQRRIVRANRALEQWVPGFTGDVRGRTIHELLHPQCSDPACYMLKLRDAAWDGVLNGRHSEYEVEDTVLRRHLEIQVCPTTRPLDLGIKQASLAVVVLQDISRIKQAEEALKNNNDQLEHLVQARTAELMQANEQLKREIVERQCIEEQLRRSENEMRLLSSQLLTVQEMERKRIASELHDGIGQSLSAIKFCMENALSLRVPPYNDQDIQLIKGVIPKMQTAIDEVRRISMNLRPSTLDDLGIIPTIAWFCREFRSIYSNIQLDTRIDIAETDVSVPLKTVIYRIMQEALNNIVKHAKAEYARIHLRKTDSAIELLVQDDGVGFDLDGSPALSKKSDKGFGIASMRERAESSGGAFFMTSGHKAGTVIHVSWPCQG